MNAQSLGDEEVRIALPWPPSVNNLYLNAGHKRVRSPRYRKWQEEAGWRLQAARPRHFDGPVEIVIDLCPPDNRRTDADNRNKALLDLLVTHQVIPGDDRRYVRSVTARFTENQVHSCVVTVRAIA
jgi:crossover junction endodeoxyribonuclease RusA